MLVTEFDFKAYETDQTFAFQFPKITPPLDFIYDTAACCTHTSTVSAMKNILVRFCNLRYFTNSSVHDFCRKIESEKSR